MNGDFLAVLESYAESLGKNFKLARASVIPEDVDGGQTTIEWRKVAEIIVVAVWTTIQSPRSQFYIRVHTIPTDGGILS